MPDSTITIVGNLTRDVELRFTAGGMPIAGFGVAVNRRKKVGDDFEDEVSFFDVSAFGSLAENLSDSLGKGSRVMVVGQLQQRSWENDEGEKRSKVEIVADAVGPDLRWATAAVTKAARKESDSQRSTSPTRPRRPAPTHSGHQRGGKDEGYDQEEAF